VTTHTELLLASESFGGHYTPAIADRLLRTEFAPRLNGFLIGNGWIHPEVQHFSFQEYGHNLGLIDEQQRAHANRLAVNATAALHYAQVSGQRADWIVAHQRADDCEEYVVNSAGLVTEDNVQAVTNPLQPQTDALTVYLNRADVRQALHVPTRRLWALSSAAANQALAGEVEKSVLGLFPGFLERLRVWIYVGNMDMTCNVVGIDGTLASIEWPGRAPFAAAPRTLWKVGGLLAGYAKAYANLTYVVVRNAGHEVPFYQPRNSLDLFEHFVEKRPFQ
jgi:carboxypeptidase C (cathepsin A)